MAFELFYVMESTYRDALLEVYQGKGRRIVELYLGASKAVQKQILVSIDKASKGKKEQGRKKQVQEKTRVSGLTNKRRTNIRWARSCSQKTAISYCLRFSSTDWVRRG